MVGVLNETFLNLVSEPFLFTSSRALADGR
jgi:hypothetical protein